MTPIKDLWIQDLREFLTILEQVEADEELERKKGEDKYNKNKKKIGAVKRKPPKKEAAKEPVKPKNKQKEKINWDSDSDTNFEVTKKSFTSGNHGKQKAKKTAKNVSPAKNESKADNDDLIERVKRKMALGILKGEESMSVQPASRSLKTGKNYQEKNDDDFVMMPVSSKKKRNKMQLDSESEFQVGDEDEDDYI